MPHQLDTQGMRSGKLLPIITVEKQTVVSSCSSSSSYGCLYFDAFLSCLIWWFYGQNVLRMVYNGTNCAEMSCMRNLCKAPAMLLPESI